MSIGYSLGEVLKLMYFENELMNPDLESIFKLPGEKNVIVERR